MIDFLNQINTDIKNIFQYKIETPNTYNVPTRNDVGLTFPIGSDKKGKLLETCVLMVDIRNSTKISRDLKKDKVKLGKIYSAFIYAMADIADEYGYVRNIIGDRIMVVFEPKDCYTNAVNCAALMYSVATKILAKHVDIENFKVGIGIDFGEMLVLKTGIRKKHEEQSEYKNLVWVGDAANTASKLCDFANKEYSSPLFKITYEYEGFKKTLTGYKESPDQTALSPKLLPVYKIGFETRLGTVSMDCKTFAKKVTVNSEGWSYDGKKVKGFEIEKREGNTAPILMSGKVFNEYKTAEPKSPYLLKLEAKQYPDITNTGSGVYGGYLIVPEINNLKL